MGLLVAQFLNRFIRLLNSETKPSQLAAGFCLGLIVGLSPFWTWHNLIVFLLVCFFRVNLSMFFLSTAIFSLVGFFLDPLMDHLGYFLLTEISSLRELWVYLAQSPLLAYFRFNNSIVLGSLVIGIVFFPLLFPAMCVAIQKYRQSWREQIKKSKLVKSLQATKFYKAYQRFDQARASWRRWSE